MGVRHSDYAGNSRQETGQARDQRDRNPDGTLRHGNRIPQPSRHAPLPQINQGDGGGYGRGVPQPFVPANPYANPGRGHGGDRQDRNNYQPPVPPRISYHTQGPVGGPDDAYAQGLTDNLGAHSYGNWYGPGPRPDHIYDPPRPPPRG